MDGEKLYFKQLADLREEHIQQKSKVKQEYREGPWEDNCNNFLRDHTALAQAHHNEWQCLLVEATQYHDNRKHSPQEIIDLTASQQEQGTSSNQPLSTRGKVKQIIKLRAEKQGISQDEAAKEMLHSMATKKGLSVEKYKQLIQEYRSKN